MLRKTHTFLIVISLLAPTVRADTDARSSSSQNNLLSLETPICVGSPGDQIQVQLWLRNPSQSVTGFQAFVQFDPAILTFLGTPSCYTKCSGAVDPPCDRGPFQLQFPSNIATAGTFPGAMPGQLNMSGSTAPIGVCAAPATSDALIAILVFQVNAGQGCMNSSIQFRAFGNLQSELSFQGNPIPTNLSPTSIFVFDNVPPVLTCPADAIVPCTESTDPDSTGSATASDNCSTPAIMHTDTVIPSKDPAARTILRTWSAVDACGNQSTCLQTIEVAPGGADTDSDGVLDCIDNCPTVMNPDQNDCDSNGIGNACDESPSPEISTSPADQMTCAGQSVLFEVMATGQPPLSFQWRRNGDSLEDVGGISGSQSATLQISVTTPDDSGSYDCLVSNLCGSTPSRPAELSVFLSGSGDPNDDGLVDGLDVQGMVDALLFSGQPAGPYCACEMNGDGIVTQADVPILVSMMLGN